jgi:hypothetical protein
VIASMIPKDQTKYNNTEVKYGAFFTAVKYKNLGKK